MVASKPPAAPTPSVRTRLVLLPLPWPWLPLNPPCNPHPACALGWYGTKPGKCRLDRHGTDWGRNRNRNRNRNRCRCHGCAPLPCNRYLRSYQVRATHRVIRRMTGKPRFRVHRCADPRAPRPAPNGHACGTKTIPPPQNWELLPPPRPALMMWYTLLTEPVAIWSSRNMRSLRPHWRFAYL